MSRNFQQHPELYPWVTQMGGVQAPRWPLKRRKTRRPPDSTNDYECSIYQDARADEGESDDDE